MLIATKYGSLNSRNLWKSYCFDHFEKGWTKSPVLIGKVKINKVTGKSIYLC